MTRRGYEITSIVALLAEGVDRNIMEKNISTAAEVALLAEGVDRNPYDPDSPARRIWSPSSRRAWIEILRQHRKPPK